jgi:hypothetical protein
MITTTPNESLNNSPNNKKIFKQEDHMKLSLPVNLFNDFFSIGADAKIALDFHLARG